jgi:hypothetical protein
MKKSLTSGIVLAAMTFVGGISAHADVAVAAGEAPR